IDSLAVLPFAFAAADTGSEVLSDGLTENLIDNLSQVPNLKIIARSSVYPFKGKNVDPRDVARQLGVKAVLTGDVGQRAGELQIHAELVSGRDARRLWGDHYERPRAGLMQLQQQISGDITEELKVRLTPGAKGRLRRVPTTDPEAYRLYLRGLAAWNKQSNPGMREAAVFFQEAIARDPGFAKAYAGLANTYWYQVGLAYTADEGRTLSKANAERALAIDPNLSDA